MFRIDLKKVGSDVDCGTLSNWLMHVESDVRSYVQCIAMGCQIGSQRQQNKTLDLFSFLADEC